MVIFHSVNLANADSVLKLMPQYYAHDHLKFDLVKADLALKSFIQNSNYGRAWLIQEEISNQPIGYIVIAFGYSFECGGREAFVDELFIIEKFRGQGIGTSAILYAIQECKKIGIKAMRLEVTKTNPNAMKLYKKIGFNDLGRSLLTYWINPAANSVL